MEGKGEEFGKENMDSRTANRTAWWKLLAAAAVFFVLFIFSYIRISEAFDPHFAIRDAFRLERNSIDVVLVGSSHAYIGFQPMQIWEDYGIASYVAASEAQGIPCSYYVLKEFFRRQSPKVVMLEGYFLRKDLVAVSPFYMREITDSMSLLSPVRYECLADLLPQMEDIDRKWPFYFTLGAYHTRWQELKASDFYLQLRSNPLKGSYVRTDSTPLIYAGMTDELCVKVGSIPDRTMKYLEMIRELCRKNGAEFMLVMTPFSASADTWEQMVKNTPNVYAGVRGLELYAEENGFPFINFLRQHEGAEFDTERDFKDKDHLNTYGALKVTSVLGRFLNENYDLPDHRGEKEYEQWDADAEIYENMLKKEGIR